MNKARIRINELAAQVFWQKDEIIRLAMSVPGIPYTTSIDEFTPILVEKKYAVMQIQYKGTYDSAGQFSANEAITTLLDFEHELSKDKVITNFRDQSTLSIPKKISLLSAHSFGTFAAFNAILRGFTTGTAIMFSPMFIYGSESIKAGLIADISGQAHHIAKALPLTFRLQSETELNNFFVNEKFALPRTTPTRSPKVKLICVCGKNDPGIDSKISRQFVEKICDDYSNIFDLIEYIEVKNGTHDVASLLTPAVIKKLNMQINPYEE